jgi:hypothetical protein
MPRQMDRPAGSLPSSVSTWFSAQEPGLLDSRAVRRHLEPYSPHTWPKVTRLTLLYGVAALRKAYGQQPLSVGELEDLVGTHAHTRARARAAGCFSCLHCSVSQSTPRRSCVYLTRTCLSPTYCTARAQVAVTVEEGLPELMTKACKAMESAPALGCVQNAAL